MEDKELFSKRNPNNTPYTGKVIKEGSEYYFIYNPLSNKRLNKVIKKDDKEIAELYDLFADKWKKNPKKVIIDLKEFERKTKKIREKYNVSSIELLDEMVKSNYHLFKFLITRHRKEEKVAVPFLLFLYIRQDKKYTEILENYVREKRTQV